MFNRLSLLLALSLSVFAFAACGGDDEPSSGVSQSATLSSVSSAEAQQVCEWSNDRLGPARTVNCGDFEVEIEVDDCSDAGSELPPASCAATVGDFESCVNAQASDPCNFEALVSNSGCVALAACDDDSQ